jgi:hypothetical protein
MLFMVIERFTNGDPAPVGERFRTRGRLLPEGVTYQASWLDTSGATCFQIMEAPAAASIEAWTLHWDDLASFEIIPILTSADFWADKTGES